MPTYQYACTECGHQLEAVQSFTDAALVDCPECSGRLRKLYSAVGIVFKGSGFYRTDSRNGAGKANGAGAKESKNSETKSSETKGSETKSSETKSSDTASTKPAGGSASKAAAGAA